MRIGTRSRAEEARSMAHDNNQDNGVLRRLSEGGCREVYEDVTDNVIYKVQTNFSSYMRGFGNLTEYNHARTLRAQSDGGWLGRVYIPATSGYSFGSSLVIAMERIDGERASWGNHDASTDAHHEALWQLFMLGFGDMHAGNYMWMPGNRVGVAPVDMGSTRYTKTPIDHADTRVIGGTPYCDKLDKHREWKWKNADRMARYDYAMREILAPSCPCGCGLVAWYASQGGTP